MPPPLPALTLCPLGTPPTAPSNLSDTQRARAGSNAGALTPAGQQAPMAKPLDKSAWLALNHLDNIAKDSPSLSSLLTALDSRLDLSSTNSATQEIENKISQVLRFADDSPPLRVRTQTSGIQAISLRASPTYGDAILATPPDPLADPNDTASSRPREFWLKQPGLAKPGEASDEHRLISERGEIWLSRSTEEMELHLLLENICERAQVMTSRTVASGSASSGGSRAASGSVPRPTPSTPLWLNLDQDDPFDADQSSTSESLENSAATQSQRASSAAAPNLQIAADAARPRTRTIAGGEPPVLSIATLTDATPPASESARLAEPQPQLVIEPLDLPIAIAVQQRGRRTATQAPVQNNPSGQPDAAVRSMHTNLQPGSGNGHTRRLREPIGVSNVAVYDAVQSFMSAPDNSWHTLQAEKLQRARNVIPQRFQTLSAGNNKCWLRAVWSNIFHQVDINKLRDVILSISSADIVAAKSNYQFAISETANAAPRTWLIDSLEKLENLSRELHHWLSNPNNRINRSPTLKWRDDDLTDSETGQTQLEQALAELTWFLLNQSMTAHWEDHLDFHNAVFSSGLGDNLHMIGLCKLFEVDLILHKSPVRRNDSAFIHHYPQRFSTLLERNAFDLYRKICELQTDAAPQALSIYLRELRQLMRKVSEGIGAAALQSSQPRIGQALYDAIALLQKHIPPLWEKARQITTHTNPDVVRYHAQAFNWNIENLLTKPLETLLSNITRFQNCPLVMGNGGHFDISFPAIVRNDQEAASHYEHAGSAGVSVDWSAQNRLVHSDPIAV